MDQSVVNNTIRVLFCTALVFSMQAGFCCLETALSRSKNRIHVAIHDAVDFCVGAFLFRLFGYAVMFGESLLGGVRISNFCFSDPSTTHWPTPAKAEHRS